VRAEDDGITTSGASSPVVATKVRVPDAPSMGLDRLDARLDAVWSHRLGLVIAPAGSGKTSLLARFAARFDGPMGWYRAESWDTEESTLVRHLEAALGPALPGIPRGWQTVADAANALGASPGPRILLVIDDLHTIEGSPAEAALERLIAYAPPSLALVIGSRVPPRFNLSRLRVSGALLELSGDDLRFRSWEVERLFRDFYEEPLPPEELARLARRTEGWAAGLQLFHLATRGRPPEERRRLLSELGGSSRLVLEMRDYLARNVLDQLPTDLRAFLVETSVLGRLDAELADRLLGRHGSRDLLEDLERRRLFTQRLPEPGWYRYHEVLRSHLQTVLLEQVGPAGLQARFRAAADLLAESGAISEAIEAYGRAGDWDQVSRLLGRNGREVASGPSRWLDSLAPAVVASDPWLVLANARRLRAEGRVHEAADHYRRAETAFGPSDAAGLCRTERMSLDPWLDGATQLRSDRPDPFALLRMALVRDPVSAAREADRVQTPEGEIAAGLASLVAGQVSRARRDLLHAAERADAGRHAQVVASLGAGVAGLLMGQRHAVVEVEGAVASAEEAGSDWLARLGRASLALTGSADAVREADAVATACRRLGDGWGDVVASLCARWGAAIGGRSEVDPSDTLPERFRGLEAGTLETWALALAALAAAHAGEPYASEVATTAEVSARSLGVPGASLFTNAAFGLLAAFESEADEFRAAAREIAREMGIHATPALLEPRPVPAPAPGPAPATAPSHPVNVDGAALLAEVRIPPRPRLNAELRLLGGFALRLPGGPVDVAGIRPRARALLRLLCLYTDMAVHHETIEGALWPEADAESAGRNLHVAIAAVRRVLEPRAGRGSFQLLVRDGDAYRLVLPAGTDVDLSRFEAAVAAGRAARDRGELGTAERAFEEAVALYRGELLPEDGPADWVADRREGARLAAVEAAAGLAELLLDRGDSAGAARVATAALRIERYHDPLWRILIRARDEAGDQGAASRARSSYDRMLAELGVPASTSA